MATLEPKIVHRPQIALVGLSFYGNPFELSGAWTEENEIGRLWTRFITFTSQPEVTFPSISKSDLLFEVHIRHPETEERGEYEVFVGIQTESLGIPAPQMCYKVLPESLYAVFTLGGEQIISDWNQFMIQEWLPGSGYESRLDFSFECYDERFKGMDRLDESALDVYIPIRPRTNS